MVRVRIVQLSAEALAALAGADVDRAGVLAGLSVPPWQASDEAISTWRRRAVQVLETPADLSWVTGLLVDEDTGAVVGKAGFHAAPAANGTVEVGYAVDPVHRRRGYARAALDLMVRRARTHPDVRVLRASVAPDNDASLATIAAHPFVQVGEQWDDEDGLELVFELDVRS